jgi:putative intracellular protease/amidase
MTKSALILLTSVSGYDHHGTRRATGFYWEELAAPYWHLRDAGVEVGFASVQGGMPPADPGSAKAENRPAPVARFMADSVAMAALAASTPVAEVDPARYDAIFLPGGHGTMWDLRQTDAVGRTISAIFAQGGVVAAVCHGPAGLLGAVAPDGRPLVAGRRVNGFTDAEEKAAGLDGTVPYLLETELRKQGAVFESNPALFKPHAVRDGQLVTGQNPASSEPVAVLMVEAMKDTKKAAA